MIYGFMALFAALIVAADQVTKYLVVANIPLYTRVPAIPGLRPEHRCRLFLF